MMNTKQNNVQNLVKLGLTNGEALCYALLLDKGSLPAFKIAKDIHILPHAVYRLMKRLEGKGFVVELSTSPKTFQAIPPDIAIERFVKQQETQLEMVKIQAIKQLTITKKQHLHTQIDVLTGRERTYTKFIELAYLATQEILVISIGEPVSDEIKIAARDAQERNIEQKYLFHTYNNQNRELVESWIKMGIKVKHYPDSGYHLMIFDGKKSILVANNPEHTEERTGMVIQSEYLSRALRDYFFSLWERATSL